MKVPGIYNFYDYKRQNNKETQIAEILNLCNRRIAEFCLNLIYKKPHKVISGSLLASTATIAVNAY